MKKLSLSLIVLLTLSIFSCSSKKDSTKTESSNTKEVETTASSYAYDPAQTVVSFTAFKTTDKVGVSGRFQEFEVKTSKESVSNPSDILSGLTFEIPINSLETNDKSRNGKIIEHFFGSMVNTSKITGVVKSFSNGKALVDIALNGITKEVALDAKVSDNIILLKGNIDMSNWDALGAIEALNKICYDLHKGADGKSKLWSDVDLVIKSKLVAQ
ncbi:YceI family protein [Flammeovirga sp. MY04]|uniref:YceI family protein n=1 Tax=Flammeovirga sp. MY04 TaxID=1191459 RepID=UPI00080632D5|nr:YceI family protein [Flammeovirga sp. MY04]ANQ48380.1 YceI family protein [Flammeovirga sp. MY04]